MPLATSLINELIRNEPKLKYAPFTVFNTFSSLLRTDLQKAFAYGKEVLTSSVYEEPAYNSIINAIRIYSEKPKLPLKIFLLGAEAYQVLIDNIPYPEIADIHKYYNNMADWYWRANNKVKAIDAMQKAIEVLKSKKDISKVEMASFETRLQQYKKM